MLTSAKTSVTFRVPALDCPEELALISKGLRRLDGVGPTEPNYLERALRIEYDPARVDPETIAATVRRLGFAIEQSGEQAEPRSNSSWTLHGRTTVTLIGGALLALSAVGWLIAGEHALVYALAIISTLITGFTVARAALRSVRLATLDMNALMTIAATGGLLTGHVFEAATAMFLFNVALWLEGFSLNRARNAVRSLIEFEPVTAHRLSGSDWIDINPEKLVIGDLLRVKPGERIPVDGVVISGQSTVNQAPITGESLPVDKSQGDRVFAGTLNCEGSLDVRAESSTRESTLARVARLIEQAQAARSPTERFVDQFARRYTPAVILAAIAIAVFGPMLGWAGIGARISAGEWLQRSLAMLVIACPCALVISTPVTIVCGLYRGARRGMLIKGGEHLERAGRITSIALDKTGTLTTGRMSVSDIIPASGQGAGDVLRVAAALEHHSEHPLAQAIVTAAAAAGNTLANVSDFKALRGLGVQALVDGRLHFAGNARLFSDNGSAVSGQAQHLAEAALARNPAAAVVLVGTRESILGAILVSDQPRPEAAAAVQELKQLGIHPLIMLTGDNRQAADRVAAQLGVDQAYSELLPEDKLALVQRLSEQSGSLAMVGDGVNDAPALAAASLGVAMGSQSSDTALETADVVLLAPHLNRLAELIRLGRRCHRILWQNIACAIGIKAIVLVLAGAGVATMWMAVAADVGASLLVTFNGMRLTGGESQDGAAAPV